MRASADAAECLGDVTGMSANRTDRLRRRRNEFVWQAMQAVAPAIRDPSALSRVMS